MAENDPELHARLQELDQELRDGDITQKGYEKRRTLILSQFFGSPGSNMMQEGLRPDIAPISERPGMSARGPSFSSITAGPYASEQTDYTAGGGGGGGGYAEASQSQMLPPSAAYQAAATRFPQEQPYSMQGPSQARQPSFALAPSSNSTLVAAGRPISRGSSAVSSHPGGGSSHTMVNSDYAFNPNGKQTDEQNWAANDTSSRVSTMLDASQQGYFSDFAGQQLMDDARPRESYGGPQRYSQGEAFSPTAGIPPPPMRDDVALAHVHQLPLEPRDIPFAVYDPHNSNIPMSKFDNMGAILRHRGRMQARQPAYWVLDPRGKETASITWDKLASRAEKVAQVVRDKSNLSRGDRVALVYRDTEVIEFAVALMGCFIAGVVAVPINNVDDYQRLSLLLSTTQAHLALTTDNNLKAFSRDISNQRLKWPAGVEWWKTNEFGSYHPRKKDEHAPLQVPDLAYIEFSRAPTGDLRGVVLSHRTIMHQMACLSAVLQTIPHTERTDTFSTALRAADGSFVAPRPSRHEVIMSYLDPRESCGMILGVLLGVYGGHTTVWFESKTVDTPGMYAHLISKYRATVMVADYPGLKRAAYNYQQDPMATRNFKKSMEPNFSSVRICLIDCLTVDAEFHEILADRWLKPMRNPRARELVAPMLALPEHGGMIISVRDWLGGEERMGCPLNVLDDDVATNADDDDDDPTATTPSVDGDDERSINAIPSSNSPTGTNGYTSLLDGAHGEHARNKAMTAARSSQTRSRSDLSEVLLDKESLKTNEVVVLAMGEEARKRANEPGTIRAAAFGYPIADATLALVDPETSLLCPPYTVGELWVDSPSLSGGFWALPRHTEAIFHARPYRFVEGGPTPILVEPEFLRTGLLGCIIEGKIYVLGLYEDRIRQRVEWVEHGVHEVEHRYFFVQHLVVSVMKRVPKIYDCSAFDAHVNGEYLPIILIESQAASTAPTTAGGPPRQLDIPFLDSLSERVMEVLYQEHHLRVFCVMMTAPNTLPRVIKNGRREIGNMLCRKEFDNGNLPCVHVKFGVERAVQNLPLGDDPAGGVWSPMASQVRHDLLAMHADKQYSGVDHREVVMDDRTSTPLNQFSNIHDLMQWRVARQAEELAYCTIDGRGREGRGINWRKFDHKVAAVAMYLKNKVKVQAGDHLLLMYTHSEEYVYAVHACICLGAVIVPMAPIDANRLSEDAPAILHTMADFRIKAILVNADVDALLKQKAVSQHLKQSALILKVPLPPTYNTTKPPKQSHGCREHGLTIRPAWIAHGYPVAIWVYWTPDQRRVAVQLGHDTLMALCKVQKETCQMTSTRPVLGCVRSTIGLGFLHTCLLGIFLAAPTYLVSPVDFAGNPHILFSTVSRYKIKDTYATAQMLDHAIAHAAGKTNPLYELKNLMIATDQRPSTEVYSRVRTAFAPAGLDRTAINTIYGHVLNPMVASRSYMCIEPVELYLDPAALRRGLVAPVDPDQEPFALRVQDSGMVPVSTQISIVNPETNRLCLVGEYGEIWVQSEANAHSFYGSKDAFDAERFNGRTVDGDPNVRYLRTGDLGFLHNVSRPIGPGGNMVEMQVLFVLGSIGETFEVNGLQHFPMDVEASVEKCHRALVPSGCAIFQAGSLLVLIAEVRTRAYLASLVPIIVNTVLNEHQLVLDIVAFVGLGDFPRSRLGEKQRGKILAGWVSRKMRTLAQFSIRDPDAEGSVSTIGPDEHMRMGRRGSAQSGIAGSMRRGGGAGSLRHMESFSQMHGHEMHPPLVEGEALTLDTSQQRATLPSIDLDDGYHQPSTMYDPAAVIDDRENRNDDTPTNETSRPLGDVPSPFRTPSPGDMSFPPRDASGRPLYEPYHGSGPAPPAAASAAALESTHTFSMSSHGAPDLSSDPTYDYDPGSPIDMHPRRGELRIANRTSEIDDDWGVEALRDLNLGQQG